MQASKRNGKRSNSSGNKTTRGGTFRPPIIPQVFSLTPFNSVLIRLRESQKSPWNISVGDVHAIMVKQLGFTGINFSGETGFEIKFQSILVWNVVDTNSDLSLVAKDPTGTSSTELARVDSLGMKNMYARAGYSYPMNVSNTVFHSIKDASKQLASLYATRPGYEVHFKILWRGAYFSVSSTLGYEDFHPAPEAVESDDIDADIDALECKLRILELRKLKITSRAQSVCD